MRNTCNGCTECCYVMGIKDLSLDYYTACPNCEKGCKIYPERPAECKTFECFYITGVVQKRPDRFGIMIFASEDNGKKETEIEFFETRENAFLEQINFLKKFIIQTLNIFPDVIITFWRYGSSIRTPWNKDKEVAWVLLVKKGQFQFSVRSDHKQEDCDWWDGWMVKFIGGQ